MSGSAQISERSRRVAKNTLLLYLRMFLMMLIGLYTYRIILASLGVENVGIYNTVAGLVTMFTMISGSISQAVSRFLTFELGRGGERSRRIFAASIFIMGLLSILLVILGETIGLWWLHHKAVIPQTRMGAAEIVLQCSLVTLVITLFATPYNATIIAHEKMGAFAYISIVEAILKLAVAAGIVLSPVDRLGMYAVLMAVVALIVRFCYAIYCKRHFSEAKGAWTFESGLLKEMAGFAGWNFFGSSAFVLNTQGMNQLTNAFFGVGANAARETAMRVEAMVKQFVSNFLQAMNPQITKSYAEGDTNYCFNLVSKGAKFTFLILILFAVPMFFETDYLLGLWLEEVPPFSTVFTQLAIVGIMVDMVCNPLTTLEMAYGKIRNYFLITGGIAYLALPTAWVLFKFCNTPVWTPYIVFIGIYMLVDAVKCIILKKQINFPVGRFLRDTVLRCLLVMGVASGFSYLPAHFMQEGILRLMAVLATSTVSILATSWILALTKGEKTAIINWIKSKI